MRDSWYNKLRKIVKEDEMSELLPPYHKVMFSALECHLANDRIAELEAKVDELQAEIDSLQWKLGEKGLV